MFEKGQVNFSVQKEPMELPVLFVLNGWHVNCLAKREFRIAIELKISIHAVSPPFHTTCSFYIGFYDIICSL